MTSKTVAAAMLTMLMAQPAAAQDRTSPSSPATNPFVDALAACIGQREDARRLACFDAAAGNMVAAERRKDVVVVDREDVKKTRRSLYGLNLGTNEVFAGRDNPADRIDKLDTTLVAAREVGNGRWSLALAEGGRWQTTETWTLTANLKPGMTVAIHPGALGSFVARIGNQRPVRVQRVN